MSHEKLKIVVEILLVVFVAFPGWYFVFRYADKRKGRERAKTNLACRALIATIVLWASMHLLDIIVG